MVFILKVFNSLVPLRKRVLLLIKLFANCLKIQKKTWSGKMISNLSDHLPHFACIDILSITMTSYWAPWRLKSPVSRLFTQPFIQGVVKENIKAPRHWPLRVNSPVTGEFPAQRASNAETASIWWRHHDHMINHPNMSCMKKGDLSFKSFYNEIETSLQNTNIGGK